MKQKHHTLVLLEEIFNSITHGLGAIGAIVACILLGLSAMDKGQLAIIGSLVFGITLFIMYLVSTLYHSLTYTKAQKVFFIFDRSAIFLLIAGTSTPIILKVAQNPQGITLLVILWILAVTGITLNAVFPDKYPLLYVPVYLLMGWIGVSVIGPLGHVASMNAVWLFILGGVFYSIGTIFHGWNKLPFNHTIWHLFVIAGSLCHFLIILKI